MSYISPIKENQKTCFLNEYKLLWKLKKNVRATFSLPVQIGDECVEANFGALNTAHYT